MFIRKHWLPISVFIVAVACVGFYLLTTQPQPDPIIIYKAIELDTKPKEEPKTETAVDEKPPQPGHTYADENAGHEGVPEVPAPVESPSGVVPNPDVSAPVGSASPRFHDPYFRMIDGFAITSEFAIAIAPSGVGPDFAAMSDEELAAAIAKINSYNAWPPGALWPPEGYYYPRGGTTILSDGDNIWLDDNGHPILKKNGTPFMEIVWSEGFRPPPDVYADYKALYKRYISVSAEGEVAAAERDGVKAEMAAVRKMYRGAVPGSFISGSVPLGIEPHTYFAQFEWVRAQMMYYAFESGEIGYLMDRYSSLKALVRYK